MEVDGNTFAKKELLPAIAKLISCVAVVPVAS